MNLEGFNKLPRIFAAPVFQPQSQRVFLNADLCFVAEKFGDSVAGKLRGRGYSRTDNIIALCAIACMT